MNPTVSLAKSDKPGDLTHPEKTSSPGRYRLPRFPRRLTPGAVISVAILMLVFLWALFPSLFASRDPLVGIGTEKFLPPSAEHWFGTDSLGRDVYTRVVHGTSASLEATVIAIALAFTVGTLLGAVAGYCGTWIDVGISRSVDVLLAIPSLLMSLAVITVLGFGTLNIALAVGISSVAVFVRIMRVEVQRVSTSDFVKISGTFGSRWHTTIRRHVIPHSAGPVLALLAMEFGTAVLAVSALSFLGYGAEWPAPEWGALISDGRTYLRNAWWISTLPGVVVVAVVLSANHLGRHLRTAGSVQ